MDLSKTIGQMYIIMNMYQVTSIAPSTNTKQYDLIETNYFEICVSILRVNLLNAYIDYENSWW